MGRYCAMLRAGASTGAPLRIPGDWIELDLDVDPATGQALCFVTSLAAGVPPPVRIYLQYDEGGVWVQVGDMQELNSIADSPVGDATWIVTLEGTYRCYASVEEYPVIYSEERIY